MGCGWQNRPPHNELVMALRSRKRRRHLEPEEHALRLAMELLAIPGASGQEAEVIRTIAAHLRDAGVAKSAIRVDSAERRMPLGGTTGNLICKLPGTRRGPRRLFTAHCDTVPICAASEPHLEDGVIRSKNPESGVGADNRAGVAVLLATVLHIMREQLPHPPLTFFWPVQEERGLHGARLVKPSHLGRPRLSFNFDGGDVRRLTIGATGGYRMAIHVRGLASHAGGHPEQGVSAIAVAALAIADLVEGGWHGLIKKGRHSGTANVGVFAGGDATNVVTDYVFLRAEARSHDPKFRARILKEIERAFRRAAKKVRNDQRERGNVEIDSQLDYESFCLPLDDPSVLAAEAALRDEGVEVEFTVANGGLDANWLTAHGMPTVSLGCGQRQIHTVDDHLVLEDFHRACRVALCLATDMPAT